MDIDNSRSGPVRGTQTILQELQRFINKSFGGRYIIKVDGDTAGQEAWTGTAYAVLFLTDAAPSVFTITNGKDATNAPDTDFSGITYPKGGVIYADITALTLAAGEQAVIYTK